MKFEGTSSYIATEDLKVAVNAAITLERPIIVKGEPGTGKTMLAHEVAKSLDAEIITWHIKSTLKLNRVSTNMMLLQDCEIRSLEMKKLRISKIILAKVSYGMLLRAIKGRFY